MNEHSAERYEGRSLLAVYRAIATVEGSRRTHAEWLDHWRRMESEGHEDCAQCIETAKVAGGREHQEKCIEEYDNVLAVLRRVAPPGGSYRPCAGCDSVGESCSAVGCPATSVLPPAPCPHGVTVGEFCPGCDMYDEPATAVRVTPPTEPEVTA